MLKSDSSVPKIGSIATIIAWFMFSWFIIHFLAIFGIFLAVTYPLWWFLIPKQTVCLFCRAKINVNKQDYCPLCRREINKNETVSPKNFSSAVFNGGLILLFSIVSIGLVFGESRLLFKLGFPPTPKTVSFLIPTKGQYRLGEIFPMKIEIAGIKTPINAVQADLGFDSTKLEIEDISTEDSFADIFIQKELNNEGGYARLTGGLPNPGFFSDKGVFGTAFFKGKTPGVVKIEFLPSSMVLANDGKGTNVLKDLASVSYLILPEKISDEEEEMQKQISLQSAVLGKTTENTQIKFYDDNKVLGTQVSQEIQKEKKFSLFKVIFSGLEKIDRFVLELWRKAFGIFRR